MICPTWLTSSCSARATTKHAAGSGGQVCHLGVLRYLTFSHFRLYPDGTLVWGGIPGCTGCLSKPGLSFRRSFPISNRWCVVVWDHSLPGAVSVGVSRQPFPMLQSQVRCKLHQSPSPHPTPPFICVVLRWLWFIFYFYFFYWWCNGLSVGGIMEKLKSSVRGTLRLFQRMVSSCFFLAHTNNQNAPLYSRTLRYVHNRFSPNKNTTLSSTVYFSLSVIFPLVLPDVQQQPLLFVVQSELIEMSKRLTPLG